jgi:hypothetical protein
LGGGLERCCVANKGAEGNAGDSSEGEREIGARDDHIGVLRSDGGFNCPIRNAQCVQKKLNEFLTVSHKMWGYLLTLAAIE